MVLSSILIREFTVPGKNATLWTVHIFYLHLTIPPHIAAAWFLESSPTISVWIDVRDDQRHPHMWATKSHQTDDGRKVGIRISKVIDDVKKEFWLHK